MTVNIHACSTTIRSSWMGTQGSTYNFYHALLTWICISLQTILTGDRCGCRQCPAPEISGQHLLSLLVCFSLFSHPLPENVFSSLIRDSCDWKWKNKSAPMWEGMKGKGLNSCRDVAVFTSFAQKLHLSDLTFLVFSCDFLGRAVFLSFLCWNS